MATVTGKDHIDTTLYGGELCAPGLTPDLVVSNGLLTVIGGDGAIFNSNHSEKARPVILAHKFLLSGKYLFPSGFDDGLFFDSKKQLANMGLTIPNDNWIEFRFYCGTENSYIGETQKAYGSRASGAYPYPDYTGWPIDVSQAQPSGNFYQTWYQDCEFRRVWYHEDGYQGPGYTRTVKLVRYKTIATEWPYAVSEEQYLEDSVGELELSDFAYVEELGLSDWPQNYFGELTGYCQYFLHNSHVEFDLATYVPMPDPDKYGQAPQAPGTKIEPPVFNDEYYFIFDENGWIRRFYRNGEPGSYQDNTPMGFSFFDAAANNFKGLADPGDSDQLTGAFAYEHPGPDDVRWSKGTLGSTTEVSRLVGRPSYYRDPHTRQAHEQVYVGQSQITYQCKSVYDLNEASAGETNNRFFNSTLGERFGVVSSDFGTPTGGMGNYWRDDWGVFNAEASSIDWNVPWLVQSVTSGGVIQFDKIHGARLKISNQDGLSVRANITIEKGWPVEEEESFFDTYEYVFFYYEEDEQTVSLTPGSIVEINLQTDGRHPVCFSPEQRGEPNGTVGPDVVQGYCTITINSAEVYRDDKWEDASANDVYLHVQYRGGDHFKFVGAIIEGTEGVWPDDIDTTELHAGTEFEFPLVTDYTQSSAGTKTVKLNSLGQIDEVEYRSDGNVYFDNMRGSSLIPSTTKGSWTYVIEQSKGTTTDLGDGTELIEFDINPVGSPSIDQTVGEYQSLTYTYHDPPEIWEDQVWMNYYDRLTFSLDNNPNTRNLEFCLVDHQWKVSQLNPA